MPRPRIYEDDAAKQRAYNERKRQAAAKREQARLEEQRRLNEQRYRARTIAGRILKMCMTAGSIDWRLIQLGKDKKEIKEITEMIEQVANKLMAPGGYYL
jgi:hypothetical protein